MNATQRAVAVLLRAGYQEHTSGLAGRRRFVGRRPAARTVWIERGRLRASASDDRGESVPLTGGELERFLNSVEG